MQIKTLLKTFVWRTSVRKGFTILELLVASSVFVTGATFAFSALFAAEAAYARVDKLRSVMDSLNISMEVMTRNIRYGTIFFCGESITDPFIEYRKSCPHILGSTQAGGSVLVFKPVDAVVQTDRIGFYVEDGKLYQYNNTTSLTSPVQLTTDDVHIESVRFFLRGANTTQTAVDAGNTENSDATVDMEQPIITIVLAGRTNVGSRENFTTSFELESSVTPRSIDI